MRRESKPIREEARDLHENIFLGRKPSPSLSSPVAVPDSLKLVVVRLSVIAALEESCRVLIGAFGARFLIDDIMGF